MGRTRTPRPQAPSITERARSLAARGGVAALVGTGEPDPVTPLMHHVHPDGTTDLLVLAGGGIHGHPDGSAAGVESMRDAWESAARGGSAEDALASSAALRRASERFGPVRA